MLIYIKFYIFRSKGMDNVYYNLIIYVEYKVCVLDHQELYIKFM
jgi:hypothetical protein